ncbi:hypothetical protein PVAND_009031 [Polypedilum vanderplanki]|uniref:F-box domain-containing protein n=1 Tax=Polypedilum vanderplanki TaxID=319348 RepID=A0A9J6CBN1_POLVA|nr:hypothetical protein PVAND_009031 [Polypedilum vanderplanki]
MSKKVQIKSLPDEILMEIFGYVDQKWQLSMTCKTFYYICCKVDENRYLVKINGKMIMNDKIFASLKNTSRKFDEVHISGIDNDNIYKRVLQILMKHNKNIISLHLATTQLTKSQYLNLFNTASNVNQIVIKSVAIKCHEDKKINMTRIKKLKDKACEVKSIEITSVKHILIDQHCDRKILFILNEFPSDSLETLILRFPTNDMKLLQQFLCKQHRLQKLTIYTNFIHSISIVHLHLTHLTIESRTISIDLLKSQRSNLTYLSIINFPLNDDEVFEEICSFKHLKVLKIFIGNISYDKIRTISRLQMLEELTVKSAIKIDEGQLTVFCSMKFTSLVKLELLLPNLDIRDENLIILSKSLMLLYLRIESVSISQFFIVLTNFSGLECLKLVINSKFNEIDQHLNEIHEFNGNLKKLSLNFIKLSLLNKLSITQKLKSIFPNVKNLEVN